MTPDNQKMRNALMDFIELPALGRALAPTVVGRSVMIAAPAGNERGDRKPEVAFGQASVVVALPAVHTAVLTNAALAWTSVT